MQRNREGKFGETNYLRSSSCPSTIAVQWKRPLDWNSFWRTGKVGISLCAGPWMAACEFCALPWARGNLAGF